MKTMRINKINVEGEFIGQTNLPDRVYLEVMGRFDNAETVKRALLAHSELVEALKIARGYVLAVHGNISGATGTNETIVKPDLDRIDAALKATGEGEMKMSDLKIPIVEGWKLLEEGESLKEGDGFLHPDFPNSWIDYKCRPDIFKGSGQNGGWYVVPKNDTAHTWPWRRRIES